MKKRTMNDKDILKMQDFTVLNCLVDSQMNHNFSFWHF